MWTSTPVSFPLRNSLSPPPGVLPFPTAFLNTPLTSNRSQPILSNFVELFLLLHRSTLVSRWLMNNISDLFLNHSKVPSSNLFTSQRSTSDTSPKLGVRKFSMEMCRGYPKALIISVKSVQGKKKTQCGQLLLKHQLFINIDTSFVFLFLLPTY